MENLEFEKDGFWTANADWFDLDHVLEECIVIQEKEGLETFLLSNGFELDTYVGTQKRFKKEITSCQSLYVKIFSNTNRILDVEYEHLAVTSHEKEGIISLENIQTFYQLVLLVKAFGDKDEED